MFDIHFPHGFIQSFTGSNSDPESEWNIDANSDPDPTKS